MDLSALDRTPYDVWSRITQFIPRKVLCSLATVNRTFSNLAAQTRYEVITFLKFDHDTKLLCRNLSDPNIGRGDFVRRVDIHPWLVQPRAKSKSTDSGNRINSIRISIRNLFDPDCQRRQLKSRIAKRIQKDIARVTDAVIGLSNLTEYRLGWDPHRPSQMELFEGFLCPILSHIGPKLVRLSLTVPPHMLSLLASINLPRLEYLEVGVCTLEMPRKDVDEVLDAFTVFVNNLYPTLQSFSLTSRVPSHFLDLARFFTYLGKFPHLRAFCLSMPFDGAHLSSPSSLVGFLNKHHRTLRHLHLSTSRCSPTDVPLDPTSKFWIPNILTSLAYPSLSGLALALRPLKAALTPIITFLSEHSHALDSLMLTDRQLTVDEVAMILNALADSTGQALVLKRIRLHVSYLSPALLNFLAAKLPRLVLLELSFSEVVAAGPSNDQHDRMKAQLAMFKEQVRANRHNFTDWALGTIVIPEGPLTCPWWDELCSIFFECIPALHSFAKLTSRMTLT